MVSMLIGFAIGALVGALCEAWWLARLERRRQQALLAHQGAIDRWKVTVAALKRQDYSADMIPPRPARPRLLSGWTPS